MKSIFLWILLLVIIIYMITNSTMYEGYKNLYRYKMVGQIDYPGNDITKLKNKTNKECAKECSNQHNLCVGYVRDVKEGKGVCWLKKKFELSNNKRNHNSGRFTYMRK
jgi:hypothetical protein